MKKFIPFIAVVLVIGLVAACFAGCVDPYVGPISEGLPQDILSGVDTAPSDEIKNSITVSIEDIVNDATLADNEKVRLIMDEIEENETKVLRYTYFKYTKGQTTLSEENDFMMIYQRIKKQDRDIKDDIILKFPINVGTSDMMFSLYANTAAGSKGIYADGKLWRLKVDRADLVYDGEDTGLLSVKEGAWEKGSDFGDKDETSLQTQNREESKKTALNFSKENIISTDGVSITHNDAGYYEIKFKANLEVANNDSATIDRLEQDNSASGMSFNKLEVTVQVWDCGLIKEMDFVESWNGKIIGLTGTANAETHIEYSYTLEDCDHTETQAILNSLK